MLEKISAMSEFIEERMRDSLVWGAISTDGKSELIRFQGSVDAVRYQDEALQQSLLPFKNAHNRRLKFMQDGAHRTRREQQERDCSNMGLGFSDSGGRRRTRI